LDGSTLFLYNHPVIWLSLLKGSGDMTKLKLLLSLGSYKN